VCLHTPIMVCVFTHTYHGVCVYTNTYCNVPCSMAMCSKAMSFLHSHPFLMNSPSSLVTRHSYPLFCRRPTSCAAALWPCAYSARPWAATLQGHSLGLCKQVRKLWGPCVHGVGFAVCVDAGVDAGVGVGTGMGMGMWVLLLCVSCECECGCGCGCIALPGQHNGKLTHCLIISWLRVWLPWITFEALARRDFERASLSVHARMCFGFQTKPPVASYVLGPCTEASHLPG
jgi:hypothetical protein